LLNRAKALGDVLVVGVNDDTGVRRLKGPDRPINGIDDRVGVLAALSCIDHLVVFGEETSEALLDEIRPDVYAKGGDYSPEVLPEVAVVNRLGIDLQLLSLIEQRSNTRTIDDIRARRAVAVAG
jgi:rfaE bifunctional protein nucleotidyltransferase chain/domain